MKEVILSNGDYELKIVKGGVFRCPDDQESVYIFSERNIYDGSIKYGIVYDYLLQSFLTHFVVSSLV